MTAAIVEDPEVTALKKKAEDLQAHLTGLSTRLAYGEPSAPPSSAPIEQQVERLEELVRWKEGGRQYRPFKVVTVPGGLTPPEDEEPEPFLEPSNDREVDTAAHQLLMRMTDWSPAQRAAFVEAMNAISESRRSDRQAKIDGAEKAIPVEALSAFNETTDSAELRAIRLEQIAELDPAVVAEIMRHLPTAVAALKSVGRAMLDNERAFLRGALLFGPVDEILSVANVVAGSRTGGYSQPGFTLRDGTAHLAAEAVESHEACVALARGVEALSAYLPEHDGFRFFPVPFMGSPTIETVPGRQS